MNIPSMPDFEAAATALCDARLSGHALPSLPTQPENLEMAYLLQDKLHELLCANGLGPVTGHKIGCTTRVMQRYLKFENPCAGKLFANTVHSLHGDYERDRLCNPGVECELAVRLKKELIIDDRYAVDLTASRAQAADAVGTCMASIELVDARWENFARIDAASLVADDFFAAGCVLGEEVEIDPQTLDQVPGRMWINNQLVGEGLGADILGHPLDALAWLATLRQRQDQPLQSGEFVTLGSLVQTQWIDRNEQVTITLDGLGEASLRLV